MKIRYTIQRQGPGITIKAGDEATVSEEKGNRLIEKGHAVKIDEPRKKPKVVTTDVKK